MLAVEVVGAPPFGDLKPVKKFMDRQTAVARIWAVIQKLAPQEATPATPAQPAAHGAPKAAKAAKGATARGATPTAREGSKKAIVLELIRGADGASLTEIATATGWPTPSAGS